MTKYTLKIRGEETPRSVLIDAGEGVDPTGMPLTDVRKSLARYDLGPNYVFLENGTAVASQDEKSYTLGQVLANTNEIEIVTKAADDTGVQAPDLTKVAGPTLRAATAPDLALSTPTAPVVDNTATTSVEERTLSLDPADVEMLVRGLDLPPLFAPQDEGMQRVPGYAGVLKAGAPQGQRPDVDFQRNESTSTSVEARTSKEAFGIAGQASFSLPYVGASVSAAHDTASASSESATHLYFLSEVMVPRWNLRWSSTQLALIDLARAAFVNACTQTSRNERLTQLAAALQTYGGYVGTEVALGGKLYIEDTKIAHGTSSISSESDSFKAAVSFKYADIGVGGDIQKDEDRKETEEEQQLEVVAVGGDAGQVADWGRWTSSLNNINNWNLVQVSACIPTLALVPVGIVATVLQDLHVQRTLPSLPGFRLDMYADQVLGAFPNPFM